MDTLIYEVSNNARLSYEVVQQLLGTIASLDSSSHKVRSLLKHDVVSASSGSGLELLSSSLPFLSKDDLIDKLPQFISICLRFCKSTDGDRNATIGYTIFQQLVERCDGTPEAERALNNQVFGEFFSTLFACPPNSDHAALSSLEKVLRRFSRHCNGHRVAIEKYLLRFFDSDNSTLVVKAATCATLVQQIRFGGDQGQDAKASWCEYYLSLCGATDKLVNSMCSSFMDINRRGQLFPLSVDAPAVSQRTSDPLKAFLKDINNLNSSVKMGNELNRSEDSSRLSKVEKHSRTNQRLRNVLVYLQASLVTAYPTAKVINPHSLLEPIFRLITLSKSGSHADSSLDDILVQTFLPGLKISALRTLDAMLECLQASMLPYSKLFFRLAMQAIRQSSNSRKLRIQAYRTLKRWLEVVKCHNFSDPNASTKSDNSKTPEDELMKALLDDIVVREKEISLTVTAKADLKNLSKKAKRRLTNQQLLGSSLAKHAPGADGRSAECASSALDVEVRIAALNCLQTVLLTSGCFLKETSHRKVQNALVQLTSRAEFSSAETLALYTCLESSVLGCKLGLPAPTQYIFKIFSEGTCNPDQRIASFCSRALRNVCRSIHYSLPTLSFASAPLDDSDRSDNEEVDQRDLSSIQEEQPQYEITFESRKTTNLNGPPLKRPRHNSTCVDVHSASDQVDVTTIELNDSDVENNVVELDDTDESSSLENDEVESHLSPVLHSHTDAIICTPVNSVKSPLQFIPLETSNTSDEFVCQPIDINVTSKEDTSRHSASKTINEDILSPEDMEVNKVNDIEIGFGDANERIPLSFPVAKVAPSQESTHSDDLVITCGQNGERDDSKVSTASKPEDVGSDKVDNAVISVDDMLKTFVDEVNENE